MHALFEALCATMLTKKAPLLCVVCLYSSVHFVLWRDVSKRHISDIIQETSIVSSLQSRLETRKDSFDTRRSRFQPTYRYNNTLLSSFDGIEPRAFPPHELPCLRNEPNWQKRGVRTSPINQGYFFHKTYKTGSSTAAGVHLRIAHNHAARLGIKGTHCKSRFDHGVASHMYRDRDLKHSFLWTVVRDPSQRLISHFFHFAVSRNKLEPSDSNFIQIIRKNNHLTHHYVGFSSIHVMDDERDTGNRMLHDYDFVAVTERWDESMVALAMILNVPVSDVLHLSAKANGGYDDGMKRGQVCTYIVPSFVSKGMQEFFQGDEWQETVHWDYMFYLAANRSLDLTIDNLGRNDFEKELQEYRRLQALVKEKCIDKAIFPCSESGERQKETNCLWTDAGCGHECINEVAATY